MNFELSIHTDNKLIYNFEHHLKKKDFIKLNNIAILGLVTALTAHSGKLLPKEQLYGLLQLLTVNGTPMAFKNCMCYFKR